jgi:hypothetical protein
MSTHKCDNLWQTHKTHHEALLKQAEAARNLRSAQKAKVLRHPGWRTGMGNLLIEMGSRLKAQYEPVSR